MSKKKQITVTVKFFATLREYGPTEEIITIPENSIVQFLFDKYQIPEEQRRAIIIIINGKPHQELNTILRNDDIVAIFPPIGGG